MVFIFVWKLFFFQLNVEESIAQAREWEKVSKYGSLPHHVGDMRGLYLWFSLFVHFIPNKEHTKDANKAK